MRYTYPQSEELAVLEAFETLEALESYEPADGINTEGLQMLLGPEFRNMAPEEFEELMLERAAEMSPEEAEAYAEFFGKIFRAAKKGLSKVGKWVKKNAGKVGATVGGAVGSIIAPGVGTSVGAWLGNKLGKFAANKSIKGLKKGFKAAKKFIKKRRKQARRSTKASNKAAQQLMALLNNPRLLQSLLAQVTGGKRAESSVTLMVDGEPKEATFGAFMNALSHLAQKAAAEAHIPGKEEIPSYLLDESNNLAVDPGNPGARAEHLLQLLQADYTEVFLEEDEVEYESQEAYDYPEYAEDYPYYEEEEQAPRYDPMTEWFVQAGMM